MKLITKIKLKSAERNRHQKPDWVISWDSNIAQ